MSISVLTSVAYLASFTCGGVPPGQSSAVPLEATAEDRFGHEFQLKGVAVSRFRGRGSVVGG